MSQAMRAPEFRGPGFDGPGFDGPGFDVREFDARERHTPEPQPASLAEQPPLPRPKRVPAECGDLPFLIKRDGTWLYRGSPIGRKELVCLFSSVLKREPDGNYFLETPAERGRIQVEETPWVAVELNWTRCGSGRQQCITFRTNVDQIVTAGPEHPIRVAHNATTCEPTPYIQIRAGMGEFPLEARIGRAVYYELVALAVPGSVCCSKRLGVWSSGIFFPLGDLPPADF